MKFLIGCDTGAFISNKNDALIFSQEIGTWCNGTFPDAVSFPRNCKRFLISDTSDMAVEEQEVIVGIVTDIDLLQYISRAEQGSGSGSESPKGENPQC